MRYPAAETAEKHERILAEASRLFRERGFGGVSLSEIMKGTGLTHGSVYNHFASKDALIDESLAHASAVSMAEMCEAQATPEQMIAYVRKYLNDAHRTHPGNGCLMAALGSDVGREPVAKFSYTAHVKATLASLVEHFPWRSRKDARADAVHMLVSMVGAVVLSRAVDDTALADEILTTTERRLTGVS